MPARAEAERIVAEARAEAGQIRADAAKPGTPGADRVDGPVDP
jgi:hypothetical protein